MRTPRWLALLAVTVPVSASMTAGVSTATAATPTWPQYQGSEGRSGLAPAGAPAPPYSVSWSAAAGIGDPTQVTGIPAPILADHLAIVVGRETVDAVDVTTGEQAWTVPRALGPSSPPAVEGDLLLFLEGGGDQTAGATSTSPTTSAPASATATASPSGSASSLVAVSLRSQERRWTVPLTDASHTGVLIEGATAVVAADDGVVTAVSLRGRELWSQDVGEQVLASLAGSDGLVFASVRAGPQQAAALVALRSADGSQEWRYEPAGAVPDLGAPSVAPDASGGTVFVVGSDASVRAVAASDGAQRWAAPVYAPTAGAPPAIATDAVAVADQSGTVYALDRDTGAERWRFATNRPAVGPPLIVGGSVIQPATDGTLAAISLDAGRETWHASVSDSAVFGLAAAPGVIVASSTGSAPRLSGLVADAAGQTEDLVSPTTFDPGRLIVNWLAAGVPLTVAVLLIGRLVASRMGHASLGGTDDDAVDPWELGLEDEP